MNNAGWKGGDETGQFAQIAPADMLDGPGLGRVIDGGTVLGFA
ncbi:MAG TPA: hypothetical protein VLA99_09870 [Nitrospiraceae bacterium]|nr:hypothetical protein [Nitrospiraceae bacterium]